jgi:D-beta-D-heptose 7-phosphate kinase/D-beta-D-heptose 1-phosphate adenosyltransferase
MVVSDYAKGLLSSSLLAEAIRIAKEAEKKILVDPKGKDYGKYGGVTLLTPNKREAAEACKLEEDGQDLVNQAGSSLMSELDIGALLITQGEEGMTLFERECGPRHFEAMARKVYDVTGAGDTVIATLATAIGAGAGIASATELANIAAGIAVERVGTATITINDLKEALADR